MIRIIILLGLYLGPLILGNHHIVLVRKCEHQDCLITEAAANSMASWLSQGLNCSPVRDSSMAQVVLDM